MALEKGEKQVLFLIILPIPLLAVIATVLSLKGMKDEADWVSYGGTFIVIMGTLLYIVFRDSKKRWPHLTLFQRWTKIITLQR